MREVKRFTTPVACGLGQPRERETEEKKKRKKKRERKLTASGDKRGSVGGGKGTKRGESNEGEDALKVDNPGSLSEAIRAPSDWSLGNS